jgi:hypothetical protein
LGTIPGTIQNIINPEIRDEIGQNEKQNSQIRAFLLPIVTLLFITTRQMYKTCHAKVLSLIEQTGQIV